MSQPVFNTQHYDKIAEMILNAKCMATIEDVALSFSYHFEQDNPSFCTIKFLKACGMEHIL